MIFLIYTFLSLYIVGATHISLDHLYLDSRGCLVYLNESNSLTLAKDVDFIWKVYMPPLATGGWRDYRIYTNLSFNLPSITELRNLDYMQGGSHYFIALSYDVGWAKKVTIKSHLNGHQLNDVSGNLQGLRIPITQVPLFLNEGGTNRLELKLGGSYNIDWDPVTQITIKSFKLCLYNPTLKIHLTSQIPDKISPGENVTIEGYVENPSPVDASAKISLEGFSKYFNIFPSQPYNVEIDNVRTQDNKVRFKFILTLRDNLSPEDKLFIEQQNNQLKLGKIKVSYKNKYFSVPWTTMEKDLGKITFQDVSKSQEPQSNKTPQEQPQQEQEVKEVIPIWVWVIIGLMALIILVLLVKKL